MLILALLSCLTLTSTSFWSPALAAPKSAHPSPKPSSKPSPKPSSHPSAIKHQKPGLKIKTVGPTQKVRLEGKDNVKHAPIEFKFKAEQDHGIKVVMIQNDDQWELNSKKGMTLSFSTEGSAEVEPLLVTESTWKSEGISLKLKAPRGNENPRSAFLRGNAGFWICRKSNPKDCSRKRMSFQLTTDAL